MASTLASPLVALTLVTLAACGGGGGRTGGVEPGAHFIAVASVPGNGAQLYLDDAISVDFTNAIDPASLRAEAFAFQVFDANFQPVAELPAGTFVIGTAANDTAPGRRVTFFPRLPTPGTAGGLRPGRRYLVTAGGGVAAGPLRDLRGKQLAVSASYEFTTVSGTTQGELYRNTKSGGPARSAFSVEPIVDDRAALSLLGQRPVEVHLGFDQPLNPSAANLPVAFDPNPARRTLAARGRIWLEYDDPEPARGPGTWIPTTCELTENTRAGAQVVLRPLGVLPNNATIRVVVTAQVEDLSGEANTEIAGFDRVFATFATQAGYEPRFDAVVARFDAASSIDPDAAFVEPRAEIGPGFVRASFDFANGAPAYDFEPIGREVILNTDYTQVVVKGVAPINVKGGVFAFRNVTIPPGVTVRGMGSLPMVWLVSGDVRIEGEVAVNGGDGAAVTSVGGTYRGPGDVTTGSSLKSLPIAGGVGGCGGGDGGRGSSNTSGPTYPETEAGFGPGRALGKGGGGGRMSCVSGCVRASGGGGGSFGTKGDPGFKVAKPPAATSFVQVEGQGGYGCNGASGAATRTLAGGLPGPVPFTDQRSDNDFWGSGFDVSRQIRIVGELAVPRGGSGGGGGGNRSDSNTCGTNSPSWMLDSKGGGGGGGGGVLVIQALGSIEIGPGGSVHADGGQGNGGYQGGSNNLGAGGGGGSGGMVVLMAGRKIRVHVHGGTYTDDDFTFAVTADGGVSKQSAFVATEITGKYSTLHAAATWDATPTGGFGGMGIVQLMAPAGDNADGTNTVLDDNIEFVRNGATVLTGPEKMRYLCWPGFPNEQGVLVDDLGNPTNLGRTAGGDIRPNPILLPAPFGARSKARSFWLDTGASVRRELTAPDGAPRGVVPAVHAGSRYGGGPVFGVRGTFSASDARQGFLAYDAAAGTIIPRVTTLVPATAVASVDAQARFEGRPAYAVTLTSGVLGEPWNRFAQARCEVLGEGGALLAGFRILGHDAERLWLAPEGLLPEVARIRQARVVAKDVDFTIGGFHGFGPPMSLASGGLAPLANLRLGFAFHADPSRAVPSGNDPLRFPPKVGTFLYDLEAPGVVAATRTRPFVQFEVLFDLLYAESLGAATPRVLGTGLPRPELRGLVVPYRF